MRFNSLLKRRSPSASPLRDIITTNSTSFHQLPIHMANDANASITNANSNSNSHATINGTNNSNSGYNYQNDFNHCNKQTLRESQSLNHISMNMNQGQGNNSSNVNVRCSSRCSSVSSASSLTGIGVGAGGTGGQGQQQRQQQQQQQQFVPGELVLPQKEQPQQLQYCGNYHSSSSGMSHSQSHNNIHSHTSNSNSHYNRPNSNPRYHVDQGHNQNHYINNSNTNANINEHSEERYNYNHHHHNCNKYDSSKKLYKPFQFTVSSILNVILNNIPCACIRDHYHYYTSIMPSQQSYHNLHTSSSTSTSPPTSRSPTPSQSFDTKSHATRSTCHTSSTNGSGYDYYNDKIYTNYYNNTNQQQQQQQQQQQYYYGFTTMKRNITYQNTIYFIKRYIQIFTLLLVLHLSFVGLYNRMHVPNTCEVADLSLEKLKLLNWIGRDVDYIIHDGNANLDGISTGVEGDDYAFHGDDYADTTTTSGSGDVYADEDGNGNGNGTRRRLKQQQEVQRSDAKSSNDDTPSSSSSSSMSSHHLHKFKPELPKIIHHQWKTDTVPSKYTKWYDQWKVHFPEPEYQHIVWTDDTARNLIMEHYSWFLPTYDNYDMNIKRADAARYFILHNMGGIYADLDYEPMINFYNYLPQNQVGLVESPYVYNEKTQNSFMTSPRGDPFWVHVFQGLGENAHKSVLHATGPSFLDGMMESSKHPVYTLPCENFHRIPYGELKESRWTAVFGREVITRLVPVNKNCGYFKEEDSCQFGKHHNAASWTAESLF